MILKRIDFNDGHLWVQKNANLGYGERFYYEDSSKLKGVYTNVYSNTVPDDSYCASGFGYCEKSKSYKIIAQTNLNFSNIPYVQIDKEDDNLVELLATNLSLEKIPTHIYPDAQLERRWFWEGFIEGYKAAEEKGTYTEQDLSKALSYGYHAAKDELKGISSSGYLTRFKETLKQIPDEIEIELIGEKVITTNCIHCEADAVIEPDKQFFCHRCGKGFHKIELVPKIYVKDDKIFVLQK